MHARVHIAAAAGAVSMFMGGFVRPAFAAQSASNGVSLLSHTIMLIALGTILTIVVVYIQRRRAKERGKELEAFAERQRAIIDAIPDALFRVDRAGRFLEFKPSAEFDLTFTAEQLIGKRLHDLELPAGTIIHLEAALEAVRSEGGFRSVEYIVDYHDGPHQHEARIVGIGGDEYLAIVRDISTQRRAEADGAAYRRQLEDTVTKRTSDLIEANVRLQEANRAKTAFLANMSHELRTPLNSVIGFTDLLLKGLAGDVNPEQHKQLTMVQHAGKQLLRLVDDVLDYTRIEAGRVTPLAEEFRLATFIGECWSQMRDEAEAKGLRLDIDVGRAPATLRSDRRLLQQVVLNLLSNAVKFTEEGSVTLRAYDTEDDKIVIEVEDTGIGIPNQLREVIFRAFEQGPGHLSAKPLGLGLGLAICHELTHLLCGNIVLESRVGEGTTARVTIPKQLETQKT